MHKMWKVTYTLDCPWFTDKCVDFWSATSPIRKSTVSKVWKDISVKNEVSDFAICEADPNDEIRFRILERTYKGEK